MKINDNSKHVLAENMQPDSIDMGHKIDCLWVTSVQGFQLPVHFVVQL